MPRTPDPFRWGACEYAGFSLATWSVISLLLVLAGANVGCGGYLTLLPFCGAAVAIYKALDDWCWRR